MQPTYLSVAATLVLVAGTAAAQELDYGNLTVSSTSLTLPVDGLDYDLGLDILALDGSAGLSFGALDIFASGTQAELTLDIPEEETDGENLSLKLQSIGLGAGYSFAGNYRVDLSQSRIDLDVEDLSADTSFTELGFGYVRGPIFARAAIGKGDDNSGLENVISVMGGYEFTDTIQASLSLHTVDEDLDQFDRPVIVANAEWDTDFGGASLDVVNAKIDDTNLQVFSLTAYYSVTPDIDILGSFSSGQIDGNGLTTTALGASYGITDTFDAFASYSLTQVDGVPSDIKGVSIGVQFDLGDKPTVRETTSERLTNALAPLAGISF